MNTNIYIDFQICISVPSNTVWILTQARQLLYSDLHKERPPQPFIITVWTVLTDMRKFVKFIGKIVSWSLINKVADCKFATLLKRESPPQQFASKIWEIFQSTCFYRTPPGNKFCINLKYLRKFKPQPTTKYYDNNYFTLHTHFTFVLMWSELLYFDLFNNDSGLYM